ncbi:MAG: polysaccharide deacetylase family protein, partial [Prolixibacteraceae bacterium]|nr:polysaccharide deacetylase family protein [Prolixibacteraceae bacterium]
LSVTFVEKSIEFHTMKRVSLLFCLLYFNFGFSKAGNIHSDYEVATWKGFAKVAVTYTFDDNCKNQYTVAIPLFNEFDFGGTFYPVIDWAPDWELFQTAVNEGHEVGSHTVSHRMLSNLSPEEQESELLNSKVTIDEKLSGQQCLTMAYPYCVPSNDSISRKHYLAVRHCQGRIEASTPPDLMNISSIICGDQGSVNSMEHFTQTFEQAETSNGWCVFLLHGIDNDGGYSSLSSDVMRKSLEFLDQNREDYWVATFVDVVRYLRQRDAVSLVQTQSSETNFVLQLSDELDDEIFNQALTIRRLLPESWTGIVQVIQLGKPLNSRQLILDGKQYVEFNAVPDKGEIEIIHLGNRIN